MNEKAKEIVEEKNKNWETIGFKKLSEVVKGEKFKQKNMNSGKTDILELEKKKSTNDFDFIVLKKISEI